MSLISFKKREKRGMEIARSTEDAVVGPKEGQRRALPHRLHLKSS